MIIPAQQIIKGDFNMKKEEVVEILKKRFGTSDEDLADLDTLMTAFEGIERAEYLENQIATERLEHDKALKELDDTWRTRYRERFFTGDSDVSAVIDKLENTHDDVTGESEELTIDEYLEKFNEKGEYK